MTDEQLLIEYGKTRSEAAFATLLERHLPLVYGAALRQVRDPGLAGDVAQAVFLVLAKKAERLRGGPLAGWLLGVTHLAVRDALKRRATRTRHEREAVRMRSEEAVGTGEIEAVTQALDEALARLGEADRTALALRYLEGRSLAELGTALRVSPETAGKRVQRAVGRLRKGLARLGVECQQDAIERGLGACLIAAVPQGLKAMIGQAVAGHVPATAVSVALAKEVTRMTMMSTVKTAAVAVVIAGVAIGAPVTVLALHGRGAGAAAVAPVVTLIAEPVAAAAGQGVTLSNGSTFELVGVCADPLKNPTWWDSEGHVLADSPLDELHATPTNPRPQPMPANLREYAFAYRITFPTGINGGTTSVWPGEGSYASDETLWWAAKGQRRSDVTVQGCFLNKDLESVPLAVQVACGPWEAVATFDGAGKKGDGAATISMTAPALENGGIKATVTCPARSPDYEYRMMVEPRRGNAEQALMYFMNSVVPTGTMIMYGHALGDIVRYRLERSVRAKATMNVALAPLPGQGATASAPALPAPGASRMAAIADGTYEEAVLKQGQMIDLDTGTVSAFTEPRRGGFEKTEAAVEAAGADLAYVGGPAESLMAALGMHLLPVSASTYYNPLPRSGRAPGFVLGTAGTFTFLNTTTKEPATFQFQTREGGVGVMRLEVQDDAAHSCYVRVKLVRSGGAP